MKKILDDIVIMRLILIVLLIVYHSFAPFCGSWQSIVNNQTNELYYYIGKYSYSFFLEAFVFISGLLVGFQSKKHPIKNEGLSFIKKKFKRLIVPSIIFSLIYFVCFYEYEGLIPFTMKILSGCGHLWFLPMLFWCFLGLLLFSYVQLQPIWILIIAITGILTSNEILPFRIGNSLYYFFFFYIGHLFPLHNNLRQFFMRKTVIIVMCGLFIITYPMYVKLDNFLNFNTGNLFLSLLIRILHAVSSSCGVLACYSIINRILRKPNHPKEIYTNHTSSLSPFWIRLSGYAFGIYIMQQFILKALYYYTPLPLSVDYLLVPWIGIIVATVLSIIFTHISLQTKIGRYLIG